MSEKATLLTSIPPVEKSDSNDSRPALLSPTPVETKKIQPIQPVQPESKAQSLTSVPAKAKAELKVEPKIQAKVEQKSSEKVSLLSQTREAPPVAKAPVLSEFERPQNTEPVRPVEPAVVKPVALLETVDIEAVAEEPSSLTMLQVATYASFVLNFVLAGAVAVVLFKKALQLAEERYVVSAKAMAIAGILIMLHGFFATYLYASHLNQTVSSAPLFITMAVWVFVGPAVGFITRNLLSRGHKPSMKHSLMDAGIYGVIFFLTACGVSSGIKTNAALLASIMAGFLMIVPIARSMTAFGVAKARHRELNEPCEKILIYGLLILPALLPALAFAHVCGLSDSLTLFLINFITFDFLLVVSLSLIASAEQFIPEPAEATPSVQEKPKSIPAVASTGAKSVKKSVKSTPAPQPEKVMTGNPDDPIIQFLNGETGDDEVAPVVEKIASTSKPAARSLPPRKPGLPGIKPPKKPGSSHAAKTPSAPNAPKAPNAPSRVRAPAKPKKRF
ncbi:hypothetical protein QEH59_13005 [Coraliomargarita sp. SDUM461004]|uniref:Uncharacterized protein n=1 Tax=Thalassobacterium sedimentorum TaxID=3041258 RepID=A0ABU1AL02_9BACT|nr:hypothetical protein [Coraliomargarita sp. SDUM461004]MDQ8195349.1 hypothetical protein [Coraliomargarita sp. SDUM461004]